MSNFQNDPSDEELDFLDENSHQKASGKSKVWVYFKKLPCGQKAKCLHSKCQDKKPLSCKGGSTKGCLDHLKVIHKKTFEKSAQNEGKNVSNSA